jgi:hypothetical protein
LTYIGIAIAAEMNINFLESSAKDHINIEKMFMDLTEEIVFGVRKVEKKTYYLIIGYAIRRNLKKKFKRFEFYREILEFIVYRNTTILRKSVKEPPNVS